MKKYSYLSIILILTIIMGAVFVTAQEIIPITDDKAENLYLTGDYVQIDSTIYGDVYALTGNFILNGVVDEDVFAVAGEYTQNGVVGDDLRIIAGKTLINSYIFKETVIVSSDVHITNETIISGPVKIYAGNVQIDGELRANTKISAERLVLNGVIEKDAYLDVNEIFMGPDAKIKGNVKIREGTSIDEEKVLGKITTLDFDTRHVSEWSAPSLLGKLFFLLMIIVLGTVMLLIFRKNMDKTVRIMQTRFISSLLLGLLILIAVPIIFTVIFITIIGIPLAIVLMLVYFTLIILSMVFGATLLGRWFLGIFKKKSFIWFELIFGAALLAVLSFLGWVYVIICFVLMLLGMGSLFLLIINKGPRTKGKEKTKKVSSKKGRKTAKQRNKKLEL